MMNELAVRKLGFGRRLALFSVTWAVVAVPLVAQTTPVPDWQKDAGGKMVFEVASIHPAKPGTFTPPNFALSSDDSYRPNDGLFSADFSLATYIEFAYKLWQTDDQRKAMLANVPKWVGTESFVIRARAEGRPTKDQMRLMMQSLLAERFRLKVHFETQEVAVLAMTLVKPGKTGPRLRPHSEGPSCDVIVPRPVPGTASEVSAVLPGECDSYNLSQGENHLVLGGSRNTTMDLIAASLPTFPSGGVIGRPVVNRTGLNERFDFTLEWAFEPRRAAAGGDAPVESQGPTFLEAVKEELGLKLEPSKAMLQVLVIDHVELPSEN